jgi:RimJ/RimL family protein N-acetyltransferase
MTSQGESITGYRVMLRPVTSDDIPFIYRLGRAEPTAHFSWPQAVHSPSEQQFTQAIALNVMAHFIVIGLKTGDPIGYVVAHDADLEHGTVHMGIFLLPTHQKVGLGAEAGGLLLKYLFEQDSIRKVYGTAIDQTSPTRGWNRLFRQEACLREHCWFHGRYWNEYIFAIHRRDWNDLAKRFLGRLLSREGTHL